MIKVDPIQGLVSSSCLHPIPKVGDPWPWAFFVCVHDEALTPPSPELGPKTLEALSAIMKDTKP